MSSGEWIGSFTYAHKGLQFFFIWMEYQYVTCCKLHNKYSLEWNRYTKIFQKFSNKYRYGELARPDKNIFNLKISLQDVFGDLLQKSIVIEEKLCYMVFNNASRQYTYHMECFLAEWCINHLTFFPQISVS